MATRRAGDRDHLDDSDANARPDDDADDDDAAAGAVRTRDRSLQMVCPAIASRRSGVISPKVAGTFHVP